MKARGGMTQSETLQAAHWEFREMTDPLAMWLDRHTELDPQTYVSKKDLRIKLNAWRQEQDQPPYTAHAMTKAVKRFRPGIQEKQREVAGKLEWVFLGIRFASDSQVFGAESQLLPPAVAPLSPLGERPSQLSQVFYDPTRVREKGEGGEAESVYKETKEKVVKVVNPVSGEDDTQRLFPDPDEVNPWN